MDPDKTASHSPTPSFEQTATEVESEVSRRAFLGVAAAGAGTLAATGLGCAAPLTARVVEGAEPSGGDVAPIQVAVTDNWVEPWEFRVGRHDDGPLALNVVKVPAPAWLSELGPKTLFTYNGAIPGPTIRMGGNDVLRVDLFNHLSGNNGNWAHLNSSRFAKVTKVRGFSDDEHRDGVFQANEIVPDILDWRLSRTLMYGPHDQHTTNLHTHGLHVTPSHNPNGSHSDNVLLRIIPTEDFDNRMAHTPPLALNPLHEVVGRSSYEFRIGDSAGTPTHPPGTHWYHPHPHGSTYDQVASGMAGFLIVEGDVDAALETAMAAQPAYNYRERLMLLQRIFDAVGAPLEEGESGSDVLQKGQKTIETVNGQPAGALRFSMEAGAIERWRVLNGSVDGKGYIRFVVAPTSAASPPTQPPSTQGDSIIETAQENDQYNAAITEWAESNGLDMWNMAFDGVTLVTTDGSYTARKVNSLQVAPANRADFLFQAPQEAGGYTIWGVGDNHRAGDAAPGPTLIATLTVTARDNPPAGVSDTFLPDLLGRVPVPDYLLPITETEVQGTNPSSGQAGNRTRRVIYSGWGNNGYSYPTTLTCPTGESPKKADPGGNNSMVISRMKFDPDRPVQKMALDTAEEWVLDNFSVGKPLSAGGAVDHPFHMHQNPFWVMAILVPKWNNTGTGDDPVWVFDEWTNVLPQPRWQDVVPIPNSGGRVIFRSRFPDFTGSYVNHCHLLQHEDWGMMQTVEVVWDPVDANCDWDQTPYSGTNPNGPYSTSQPTLGELNDYCQTMVELDGTVVNNKIVGGTSYHFPYSCQGEDA